MCCRPSDITHRPLCWLALPNNNDQLVPPGGQARRPQQQPVPDSRDSARREELANRYALTSTAAAPTAYTLLLEGKLEYPKEVCLTSPNMQVMLRAAAAPKKHEACSEAGAKGARTHGGRRSGMSSTDGQWTWMVKWW